MTGLGRLGVFSYKSLIIQDVFKNLKMVKDLFENGCFTDQVSFNFVINWSIKSLTKILTLLNKTTKLYRFSGVYLEMTPETARLQ